MFCGLFFAVDSAQAENSVEELLEKLRSADVFESQQAEAELLRLGPEALAPLSRAIETSDRVSRFRANQLFSDLVGTLLVQYEREQHAYDRDQSALRKLADAKRATEARRELQAKLDKLKADHPDIATQVQTLYELKQLSSLEEKLSKQQSKLPEPAQQRLTKMRRQEKSWRQANAGFTQLTDPLLALYETQVDLPSEYSDLDELRFKEVSERATERAPRVENLRNQVLKIGHPALNEALARAQVGRHHLQAFYDRFVSDSLKALGKDALYDSNEFEVVRYSRGLLWAWEVDREGEQSDRAKELLSRHTTAVLRDLTAANPTMKRRAEDELFLLNKHGIRALSESLYGVTDQRGDGTASNNTPTDQFKNQFEFLLQLLRWRVRPKTYARVGIHFADFPKLSFRKKRRMIFDYARVAGEEAMTTLRAIVANDELEQTILVRLAAAKALAGPGLRDLWAYNFLLANHPELTTKKPEVSRELLILQGYEHIRDKEYELAIDELRKVLDESPFDFQANYHIAFAHLLLKQYEKSIHYFEIARRINPKDHLTLYNLACAYALHGDADGALDALEDSVKAGFADAGHMEKDPDLQSLRDLERYRLILKKLNESHE